MTSCVCRRHCVAASTGRRWSSDRIATGVTRAWGCSWRATAWRRCATRATRLHVRYDAAHFPEDLVFQETADRTNFQGRYVLRHPWKGEARCEAARRYRESLWARAEQEAAALASLTGWPIEEIRRKAGPIPGGASNGRRWWEKLYGR